MELPALVQDSTFVAHELQVPRSLVCRLEVGRNSYFGGWVLNVQLLLACHTWECILEEVHIDIHRIDVQPALLTRVRILVDHPAHKVELRDLVMEMPCLAMT